jgi:hypothetical protein
MLHAYINEPFHPNVGSPDPPTTPRSHEAKVFMLLKKALSNTRYGYTRDTLGKTLSCRKRHLNNHNVMNIEALLFRLRVG